MISPVTRNYIINLYSLHTINLHKLISYLCISIYLLNPSRVKTKIMSLIQNTNLKFKEGNKSFYSESLSHIKPNSLHVEFVAMISFVLITTSRRTVCQKFIIIHVLCEISNYKPQWVKMNESKLLAKNYCALFLVKP